MLQSWGGFVLSRHAKSRSAACVWLVLVAAGLCGVASHLHGGGGGGRRWPETLGSIAQVLVVTCGLASYLGIVWQVLLQ